MDENIKQRNFSAEESQKPPSVPPPPPPQVGIRTMQSDIESIQQSGGEGVTPQVFTPEELKPKISQYKEPKPDITLDIPGYTGSEKPIFESRPGVPGDQSTQMSVPGPTPAPASSSPLQTEKSSALKTIILITAAAVLVVGLGLLGYYVIFPLLF